MNLVIDIGNSLTKLAVFDQNRLVDSVQLEDFDQKVILRLKNQYPELDKAILSSVTKHDSTLFQLLQKEFSYFLELSTTTPVPIKNNYRSKATLGLDRIAAAVGAAGLFPEKDLLIIDAGTAITYDIVDKKKGFMGGNISPGLKTRFRALHQFTGRLPLLTPTDNWPDIGTTTEEAIQSGVLTGILSEVESVIDKMKSKWPELTIIVTGGDAEFFDKKLKSSIFVKFQITLLGLNRILEYNVKNN
ncbi:type III pantothenate kinase [Prolixibacter bellariivorans]|uniref:Type III pantothenate kinase n=1 Tax=Prolixibacter bellariivorans TaxID=314319 RepID=A0A5M4AZJ8_9BACT|nr:type III pantothenate kinase [Prolixibacter bellariivorans]GET33148.1 type III pantothenate kinase [Prolixibacter bellariivorans]